LDGDGDVDWQDRLVAFRKTGHSVEIFLETVLGLLPLIVLGVGGFAVLWSFGCVQPILKDLAVYGYFGALLVAMLALFVYKIWRNLNTSILQFFEQFKAFEHSAEDIISDAPEHLKSVLRQVFLQSQSGGRDEFEALGLTNVNRDPFMTRDPAPRVSTVDVRQDPFLVALSEEHKRGKQLLCDFAEALLDKFKSSDDAFDAFDVNQKGLLNRQAFKEGARALPQFKGDVVAVFKALDPGAPGGRPRERLTRRDFRRLQEVHDAQAEAKKSLDAVKDALHEVFAKGPSRVEQFFAEGNARGIWGLKRAIQTARARGVSRESMLEAEHVFAEASDLQDLYKAIEQADDPEEAEEALDNKDPAMPIPDWFKQWVVLAHPQLKEKLKSQLFAPGG